MTERKDYDKELERAKEAARQDIENIRITIGQFVKHYGNNEKNDINAWVCYYLLTQTEDAVVCSNNDKVEFEIPNELTAYVTQLLLEYDEFILEAI